MDARKWYNNLTPEQKLKFAALTALYGAESVSEALTVNNDIDILFSAVANKVYTISIPVAVV